MGEFSQCKSSQSWVIKGFIQLQEERQGDHLDAKGRDYMAFIAGDDLLSRLPMGRPAGSAIERAADFPADHRHSGGKGAEDGYDDGTEDVVGVDDGSLPDQEQ